MISFSIKSHVKIELFLSLLMYVTLVTSVALLYHNPIILMLVLVGLSIFYLYWVNTNRANITYTIGFFLGPTGESLCVYLGAWDYAHTSLIPIWLPFAWALVSVVFDNLNQVISELKGEWK
tara:strand:- start:233 stop:595 length:363 start_codon:yes stop_codon:yes gene_type:complete